MTKENVSRDEELAKAKRRLVADLLNPSEIEQVSGGDGPPYYQEFTRFVMSAAPAPAPAPSAPGSGGGTGGGGSVGDPHFPVDEE